MWQRELDIIIVHLFGKRTSGVGCLHGLNLHNLDTVSSGSVSGSHVAVTLGNRTSAAYVAVFAVHVVCTRSRVVSDPDTKVLDFCWRGVAALKRERVKFSKFSKLSKFSKFSKLVR